MLILSVWGRMHEAVASASLRLKLTYDGLAHYVRCRYAERRLSSSSSFTPHRSLVSLATRGRMHDADVSASLRLKLTYDGLAD